MNEQELLLEQLSDVVSKLTQNGAQVIIPQNILKTGGLMAKGVILCNKCRHSMDTATCLHKTKGKDGTEKQCGSEKCYIEVYWKGEACQYRRNSQGETLTRKEAQDLLLEVNRLIKAGLFDPEYFEKCHETFRDIFGEYFEWVEKRLQKFKNSPGWWRNLKGYYRNYYSILDDCTFSHVDGRAMTLLWKRVDNASKVTGHDDKGNEIREGIKSSTKRKIMDALRGFYTGWVKSEPWGHSVEIPPFPRIEDDDDAKKMCAIDDESQDSIIENLRKAKCSSFRPDQRGVDAGHADVHEFMREVGIRECEVCLIKVGKVFLDNGLCGEFYMDEHLVEYPGKGWVVWPGLKSSRKKKKKEERGGRYVQMTPRAAAIAEKHMEGKTTDAYLFINPITGDRYAPDALYRAFRNHSGSEDVTVHEAWRHSFVTNVMEADISPQSGTLLTGQSVRTLENYDHPRRKRQREVMKQYLDRKVVSIRNRQGSEKEVTKSEGNR